MQTHRSLRAHKGPADIHIERDMFLLMHFSNGQKLPVSVLSQMSSHVCQDIRSAYVVMFVSQLIVVCDFILCSAQNRLSQCV